MRRLAGILVFSGLGALSWSAFYQHDLIIAWPGIALTVLWGVGIALRWSKTFHTLCLAVTASLCILGVVLKLPALTPLFAISTTLYGWDLMLMDLRLRSHPREATTSLLHMHATRSLILAFLGFAAALGTRAVHIRLSFFSALAISTLCAILFLLLHQGAGRLMTKKVSGQKKRADG